MNQFSGAGAVTDPLDFVPTSVPRLSEIDSLLRCHICKEFMVAPVLTSCGHTFCSVCVRKYLMHTPKCPICSKEIRESNLNKNVLLEQIVMSFKGVRDELIDKIKIPSSKCMGNDKKTKQDKLEVIEIDEDQYEDGGLTDDDIIFVEESRKRKPGTSRGLESLFKKKQQKKPETGKEVSSVMGTCPVCSNHFPLDILEGSHIDDCLSNPPPTTSSRSETPPTSNLSHHNSIESPSAFQLREPLNSYKKLTKLDYASLSTSALKAKLTKLDLPITGTRSQLESRYNEYLVLWNANCDSIAPKNPKVLRKQLLQWENSLKFHNNVKDKQLDKSGWEALIAEAKLSAFKSKEKENPPNHDEKENIEVKSTSTTQSSQDIKCITSTQDRFFNG